MDLHPSNGNSLLEWINSLHLCEPVERIAQLQDGCLLLKLVYKLKGEELSHAPVHLSQRERLLIVSDFAYSVCQAEQCAPLSWDSAHLGNTLELELAKVVLLLCYYGFRNSGMVSGLELKTELQMATMLHNVQDGMNGLSLSDGLEKILTMSSLMNHPSGSSVSSLSDDCSPIFTRSASSPLVPFLELNTVASSSFVGSPIQEIMNTPQVQLKRLRKELAREGDIRDELEQELAESTTTLLEKEGQISQLQHRLQRLQREQEELEKDHKTTLMELQEKNEGLLRRVHEVFKQCQDLKTDNSQKEKRIDQLTEENGTLAAQVRSAFAQLTSVEEEITKVTEAHEMSRAEWESRRDSLQKELGQALTDRECLSEQIQILQGKISVLEDELSKVSIQLQEKGEVLGPIVEREKLKQDLADLTSKHSQLEESISCLEGEKQEIETLLSEERRSFEKETLRMEGLISDLQQAVSSIRAEREAQEKASRENQQILSARILSLENDLARLHQLEVQLTAEVAISVEFRKEREKLEAQVASLEDLINVLQTKCHGMGAENEAQQEALGALRADLQIAQVSLTEYEEKLADHQRVVEENTSLHARISALDDTIVLLENQADKERRKGEEVFVAKEQQEALMKEKFQEQEIKAHEMFAELETLSQELRKMKQQKLHAESCMERLTHEGTALAASLAEQRDLAQSQLELLKKAKDESEVELQRIITEHQSKVSELQCEIKRNVESLMQSEQELCVLKEKVASKDEELVDQQQKLGHLQREAENLRKQFLEQERTSQQLCQNMTSKDTKIQQLKAELELKEGEIQSLNVSIQSIQAQSSEMHNLHQREVEDQKRIISELTFQLTEAERLASEKAKALDDLAQHLKDLKEELSSERQKAVALENNLEASKNMHEAQQRDLKLEVRQLQQEINGNRKSMEEFLAQIKSLKQELNGQRDITLEKEKEASILVVEHKALEQNFAQLQNELAQATILAKERQSDLIALQKEVEQQETLRTQAQESEEVQRKKLERELTELQSQIHDLTNLASEKEALLYSLNEKLQEQQELHQKLLQQSEEVLHKELEELKGKLDSATHQVMAKSDVLKSTQEKMKQMELLCQQKENLVIEAGQAKETLDRTVTELCTKQKQELDQYLQKLDILKNEKESFFLLNQSLQNNCQNLQAEKKSQQEAVNVLKADLKKMQDVHRQELEALKEKEEHLSSMNQSLQSKCQGLQADYQRQQEALRTDMQNTLDQHQKELETLKKEKEDLATVSQSFQDECQSLQQKNKEQQETLNLLRSDLQNSQEGYQQDLETWQKEKDDLATMSQSFQDECQNLQAKIFEHQDAIKALKADLQYTQSEFQKDLKALQEEKEHLCSINKSLQGEYQNLQTESKRQQESLSSLKSDLQNSLDQHQKELETLQKEKEDLVLVNRSLLEDCEAAQKLSAELGKVKETAQQRAKELQTNIKEMSTLAAQRETDIENLRCEIRHQEALRMRTQESENSLRTEFETKVAQLQMQLEKASELSSERNSEVNVLRSEIEKWERRNQETSQAKEILERVVTELHIKQKQEQDKYHQELDTLKKAKDHMVYVSHSLQKECQSLREESKMQQESLRDFQQELETVKKENEKFSSLHQSLQREYEVSQKIGAELEMKLQERVELIRALREAAKESEKQNQDLQEQLKLKSEMMEHYKAQVEKAKIHYSGKKQQLLEEQTAHQAVQARLEDSRNDVKALKDELKQASVELDSVKLSEQSLKARVKTLEAQVEYADRQLREQKLLVDQNTQARHRESGPEEVQNVTADSLDLDLDDSLNTTSKTSVPGESSTPLVRSSERLAAKRRAQIEGSLETLYFTPMNPHSRKHHDTMQQCKLENSFTSLGDLTLNSAKKPTSSVQRRYTTQVINITTKKMSPSGGAGEAEESFYSLRSTQSSLASQKKRPVSMEILQQPNMASSNDKLLSLPGYRRSNVHGNPPPRATSTFCVGGENEPDHVADDWMRIAELQSRNKACLPHLKSSYPLESRPSLGYSSLPITDEDVRTGDPDDTIRRASMIPGQLMDSLSSHRLSLALPAGPRDPALSQPQRYSMLPAQISAGTAAHRASQTTRRSAQTHDVRSARSPLAPKRPAGQLQDSDTPEAKKLASCFARPATPKGRNLRSTTNNSENNPASSCNRRQSMAFVIDNTPKKSGRGNSMLQRGINKVRNSARKSPSAASRLARSATGATNARSPLVERPQAKSPHIASMKSPKISNSAKKLMKFRMKM